MNPVASQQPGFAAQQISVDDLLLDPANPRLSDAGLGKNPSQEEIIKTLWSTMAVDEVALSIAENGFYQHEPLYAEKHGAKYHVVEGNRRLAAVKLLCNPDLRTIVKAASLPKLADSARRNLDKLPIVVCRREQIWTYLGFKHINGPQAWESYPKASYVAWVHNSLNVPLDEIARRIGDKHSTVLRLYDALMVLEQAKSARVFDPEDRYKEHFSFSHLTTGLGYAGIQTFLGLPKGQDTIGKRRPVPPSRVQQLGELMVWLYGSKSQNSPAVVQSQNPDLRRLDEVLRSKEATIALRKGLPLAVSLEISKGDERVFREALIEAKQNLQKARGTVLTGYTGNADLLVTAEEIAELARTLVSDMTQSPSLRTKRVQAGKK